MPVIIKNGKTYGDRSVTLSKAEYDALSSAEKLNGTVYYIYDSNENAGIAVELTQAEYDALVSPDPDIVYYITDGSVSYPTADDMRYEEGVSVADALDSLNDDVTALRNGSGQGITMIDTSHFSLTHSTVFKVGSLLVGTVIIQCTSNFTTGDLFSFNNITLPYYNFGIGAVTAGQWSYDVTKSVRIYFKSNGVVSLTSSITSGQFITIPVCLKANV